MYSMKDLSSLCGKSQQAIYRLINKNPELAALIEEHSVKNGRFINYDEEVLNWLINHYKPTEPLDKEDSVSSVSVGAPFYNLGKEEVPKNTAQDSAERAFLSELQTRAEELALENETLKNAVEALKNDLEKEKEEKRDLLKQNGALLLLLAQEKQEKQALFPPPKRGFTERLKQLFQKK